MPLPHRHCQRWAWVILFALGLAMLAPGIARAMAWVTGDPAATPAICTAARNAGAADGEAAHWLAHCPSCAMQSDSLALPPQPAPVPALLALNFETPRMFLQAPYRLRAWVKSQPRGPPLAGTGLVNMA